ncbi:MAG: rubrerythrin family protein [Nitrospirae bacterium]|nr:rubrerythrin family protein [Nitrospirota bacterium]
MKETVLNLTKAFIGESQARNRYTFYSKTAFKEGYDQISEIFLITADNEREHAKWFFRMLNDLKKRSGEDLSEIIVEAAAPTTLSTTVENIKAAIAGENFEHSKLYPAFAHTADKEGLPEIAERIRAISRAEVHHEERYRKLLKEVEAGTVFKKDKDVTWMCRKCGYTHEGKTPPDECPSCGHESFYFQKKCEEY